MSLYQLHWFGAMACFALAGCFSLMAVAIRHGRDIHTLYGCLSDMTRVFERHDAELNAVRAELTALRMQLVRYGRVLPDEGAPSIVD